MTPCMVTCPFHILSMVQHIFFRTHEMLSKSVGSIFSVAHIAHSGRTCIAINPIDGSKMHMAYPFWYMVPVLGVPTKYSASGSRNESADTPYDPVGGP